MRIMVQKFEVHRFLPYKREHVLRHVKRELEAGLNLVIVVSAMGRRGEPYATDTLLDWAAQNGNALSAREKIYCCAVVKLSLQQHSAVYLNMKAFQLQC